MEWIFIGVAIAIGFYIAPFIFSFAIGLIVLFFTLPSKVWAMITSSDSSSL